MSENSSTGEQPGVFYETKTKHVDIVGHGTALLVNISQDSGTVHKMVNLGEFEICFVQHKVLNAVTHHGSAQLHPWN